MHYLRATAAHRIARGSPLPSRAPGADPRVETPRRCRRRVAAPTLHGLAAAVALVVVPAMGVEANAWEWSSRGLLDVRARGSGVSATRLVPEPVRVRQDRRLLEATAAGGLQGWNGPLTVTGAARLSARTHSREGE